MIKPKPDFYPDFNDEVMKICAKAYDKGINDAFDTLKQGIESLKLKGFKSFNIDTFIVMVDKCREAANQIPTTYDKD